MSVAQDTLVPPAVYPHLVDFTWKQHFAIKVDLLNLDSQNKAKKYPWFSQVPQSKFDANWWKGFMSYDRTYKQTPKQRLQLYIYKHLKKLTSRANFVDFMVLD